MAVNIPEKSLIALFPPSPKLALKHPIVLKSLAIKENNPKSLFAKLKKLLSWENNCNVGKILHCKATVLIEELAFVLRLPNVRG